MRPQIKHVHLQELFFFASLLGCWNQNYVFWHDGWKCGNLLCGEKGGGGASGLIPHAVWWMDVVWSSRRYRKCVHFQHGWSQWESNSWLGKYIDLLCGHWDLLLPFFKHQKLKESLKYFQRALLHGFILLEFWFQHLPAQNYWALLLCSKPCLYLDCGSTLCGFPPCPVWKQLN